MLDMLLINALVVTVDPKHTVYSPGYVAILGEEIHSLGPMEELHELPQARRVMDLEGHPVLPGLVDGHGHAGHCMTKTLAEHLDGDAWESMVESVYYQYSDLEFWRVEGALAAAERIKFGTTTGVSMLGNTPRIDSPQPVEASLEGSGEVGIRQITGIGCANGPWPKIARSYDGSGFQERQVTPDMAYASTEAAVRRFADRTALGRSVVMPGRMGMRQWESVEDNIRHNREMLRIAREYDVPIHTHAYGGDVQFLHDHTPEVLEHLLSLTHSTGYSASELEILADSGAWVFHGPTTHANINRRCPVVEMLDQGIRVAVITDGTAPDRSFDLWREMKNVQLLQRSHFHDSSLIPCGKALEMVTIDPARALGIDDLVGSLEVGKKADLIAINTDQPHLAPFGPMPVQRLVYHAMGQDVEHAIVNGELVMEHRGLLKTDEKSLLRQADRVFATVMERLGRQDLTANPHLYELRQ